MVPRRFAVVLVAAAVFPAALVAGLTQSAIDNLPEQPRTEYTAALPGWIAQVKAAPGLDSGSKQRVSDVMIAPVVLNWAPEGLQGRPFAPWWSAGDNTGGVQSIANDTHRKVVDAFRSRNWGFYTPAWLKEQGAKLDKVGERPNRVRGRSHGGGDIAGYPYVSDKLLQWSTGDFQRLAQAHPGPRSVALIRLDTIWIYKGHSRMNGEAIVNYDVYTSGEVRVCGFTACGTAKVGPDNAFKATLPVPAEKAGDEARRADNNNFAIGLASDYFSGVALAMIETAADVNPAAASASVPMGKATGAELVAPASLQVGQRLVSKDGRFEVSMQADGNLVLYRTSDRRALWSSGSNGKGATIATMQQDGNLVLYTANGTPIWSSDTWKSGAVRAVMQDDGNFVLYKADGSPVWASGTCCH